MLCCFALTQAALCQWAARAVIDEPALGAGWGSECAPRPLSSFQLLLLHPKLHPLCGQLHHAQHACCAPPHRNDTHKTRPSPPAADSIKLDAASVANVSLPIVLARGRRLTLRSSDGKLKVWLVRGVGACAGAGVTKGKHRSVSRPK